MSRGEPEAVGYDLFAPEPGQIDPLCRKRIALGFATAFSNGYVGRYMDKSGMANKGIHMLGGVVDPSYRGEWQLILYNTTHEVFSWEVGQKLIQVVFMKVEQPVVNWTEDELPVSVRGEGRFGSTGLVSVTPKVAAEFLKGPKYDVTPLNDIELTVALVRNLRDLGYTKAVLVATSGDWKEEQKLEVWEWTEKMLESRRTNDIGHYATPACMAGLCVFDERLSLGAKSSAGV